MVRVATGNFLEMYDFMVFGYYAAAIGRTFFPKTSEFASLMLSLATFGAGFLMRPLGALVLGAYIDRKGRRTGLMITLGLMSLGTLSIAFTPGYRTIGLLACRCWSWQDACCKASRPASNSAACQSTCLRSRRPETKGST